MVKKWYSNGLKESEAKGLEKKYAKIENPIYGLTGRSSLALQFDLNCEDGDVISYALESAGDITWLLDRTNTSEISELEGKIIETFVERNMLKGLSVNENLI